MPPPTEELKVATADLDRREDANATEQVTTALSFEKVNKPLVSPIGRFEHYGFGFVLKAVL